jgi:hypothetical protein
MAGFACIRGDWMRGVFPRRRHAIVAAQTGIRGLRMIYHKQQPVPTAVLMARFTCSRGLRVIG